MEYMTESEALQEWDFHTDWIDDDESHLEPDLSNLIDDATQVYQDNKKALVGANITCPTCGKRCEVYSRIVGYLRPVDQWNKGKQHEFNDRKVFSV